MFGPQLYEYFQKSLKDNADLKNHCEYTDFHSGAPFRRITKKMGGVEAMMNDIFVVLSSDGVQPFKSSTYSYWSVVLNIANLHPSIRTKSRNLLPVLIIPGPSSPNKLTSFLKPLIDELTALSLEVVLVRLWDGRTIRVRVHLLFVTGDLPAIAKAAHLRGHNALSPCRFCFLEGIYFAREGHVYYPDVVRMENNAQSGRKQARNKCIWSVKHLSMRTDEAVRKSMGDIKYALQNNNRDGAEELAKKHGLASNLAEVESPVLLLPTIESFAAALLILCIFFIKTCQVSSCPYGCQRVRT